VTAKREKPFHLDMGFDEALRRFVGTDPRELDEPNKASKKERAKRLPKSNQTNQIKPERG
jgi:hypothetical protein